MRIKLLIILVLSGSGIFSQKKVLEFKLSKPENGIQINLADTVFRIGDANPFQVISTGDEQIMKVEVLRGDVYKVPLGWYEANFKKPGPTVINVYTKNSRGETYLAMTKAVQVMPLPIPNIYICGVKADSALNIEHLVKDRKITARMKNKTDYDYHPSVLSFGFILNNDSIYIKGDEIPFNYKSKLYDLSDGGVFTVFDVRVMLPNKNKNIITIPQASVFLVNTDQYSVGERKYIHSTTND